MLSKVKSIFSNMHNAFYEFAFPKGVRWYRLDPTVKMYRYPAPGSEPLQTQFEEPDKMQHDYKEAYRDSRHNIRYEGPYSMAEIKLYYHEALGETVEEKMIRLGFIEKKDGKVQLKLEAAKQLYIQKMGKNPELPNTIQDDFGYGDMKIEKGNRDQVAQMVRQQFQENKERNEAEYFENDLNQVYNHESFIYTSWGIADNDPVYQQVLLDVELAMNQFQDQERKFGQIPVFKGDNSYWDVLDNSHEPYLKKIEQSHNKDEIHKHEALKYPLNQNKVYEG